MSLKTSFSVLIAGIGSIVFMGASFATIEPPRDADPVSGAATTQIVETVDAGAAVGKF